MFKFLILCGAVSCALGVAIPEGMVPQLDGRIVGGDPTTIGEFPWQISIQRGDKHFCGGTIIGKKVILTAAHCLQNVHPSDLKIRAGSTYSNRDGVVVGVAAFKNHEGYNPNTMVNDISIIYLISSLTTSSTMRMIPLSVKSPADGTIAAVSGWGRLSSGGIAPKELRFVEVDVVSPSNCSSSTYGYGSGITRSMLCAYTLGKDSCQGDSGGPMVAGGAVVGIVSWGYGCAYANYPGVYTDVAAYYDWIVETSSSF